MFKVFKKIFSMWNYNGIWKNIAAKSSFISIYKK